MDKSMNALIRWLKEWRSVRWENRWLKEWRGPQWQKRWLKEWRNPRWENMPLRKDYEQHGTNGPVVSNLREVDGVPHVDLSDGTTIKSVDGGKTWREA